MLAVLSPYHLTSREPAAMTALQLADHVVTLLPTVRNADTMEAAADAPRYVQLIESWSWTRPLWEAGVLASGFEGDDAARDVHDVTLELIHDDRLADLRPMLPRVPEEDEARMLGAIAHDLLRAGPNPTISLPVAAGLDRFAARYALVCVRSGAASVAQKLEASMTKRLGAVAIPVLVQASAERLLELREHLGPQRLDLAGALADLYDPGDAPDGLTRSVRTLASAYEAAFQRALPDLLRPDPDADAPPVRWSLAAIEAVNLPVDAVLRSSVAAARIARGRGPGSAAVAVDDAPPSCAGLLVRPIGRPQR
ncbi:MAG: hypothetical protein AAF356_03780 [Planctomycetota bacterium]